ncbi:hypothetical protein ABL57_01835 [Kocuria sp. SM24M-10]|nr:hypothetical protein ABL57_01835 [Kocuria sp. SM24M-10]
MGEAVEVAAGFQFVEGGRDTSFGGGPAGGEISQGQSVLRSGADQGPQDPAGLCAELGIVAGLDKEGFQCRAQCCEDGRAGRCGQDRSCLGGVGAGLVHEVLLHL